METIIHADWSVAVQKRWQARATREGGVWTLHPPVRGLEATDLLRTSRAGRLIAGFDFPIGVPAFYGRQTGFRDFPTLLDALAEEDWAAFLCVAAESDEISVKRPFYPHRPGGRRQEDLIRALGAERMDDLRRCCDRATDERPAAPLFWTLGANQVGKAALDGWMRVILPARRAGAALWPYDRGTEMLERPFILAETYPAEAMRRLKFMPEGRFSKRRQADRATVAARVIGWAERLGARLSTELLTALTQGFGADRTAEDRFDAVVGLCGMIDLVERKGRAEVPALDDVHLWEGWIFGRSLSLAPAHAGVAGERVY
ncbi:MULTISPECIES: hypothetical protein [unclassified Haematobacter]|uniref:hypothetical protein n=1 Tax=unclassified Haematobacter TaxID=2640585 RepID=UPI0025BB2750|nr:MULTISPECIES: hypothetical protein [unclassified Haematobacter]